MSNLYTYSLSSDFSGDFSIGLFGKQIEDSGITSKIKSITKKGDVIKVTFKQTLSALEDTTLSGLLGENHTTFVTQNKDDLDKAIFFAIKKYSQAFSNSWTDITWDTEKKKDSIFDHSTNGSEITLNQTGLFRIDINISTEHYWNGSRSTSEIRILKNGQLVEGSKGLMYNRNSGYGDNTCSVNLADDFNYGDVIKVQIIRHSGSGFLRTYPEGCRILIESIQ